MLVPLAQLVQQRLITRWPDGVEIGAHAQHNLLRVQNLPRIRGRAVLRASTALHAAVRLQRNDLRQVFAREQPKIFLGLGLTQLRNIREPVTLQKHRQRTEHEMQVLRARNDRQKHQQRHGMYPPPCFQRGALGRQRERRQVAHHQQKNQRRNHARLDRDLCTQPPRPREKPPHKQTGDRYRNQQRPQAHEVEIKLPYDPRMLQHAYPQPGQHMIRRHQRERQKSPEHKRVRQPLQRPLLNHLALAQHLGDELPQPPPHMRQRKTNILLRVQNIFRDRPQPPKKYSQRKPA